jgi:HK97 family phage major capsid protein
MNRQDSLQRLRSVEMLARQTSAEAKAALSGYPARRDDPSHLSLGELMLSMMVREGGRGGWAVNPEGFVFEARDEWRRSDENTAMLPDALAGAGGRFASRSHRRDCGLVDWDWLRAASVATRAMATIPGSKGGYMVNVGTLPAVDPLWQDSIIGATGVQRIEGLTDNAQIPRGTGAVTVTWQSAEGVAPSAVDAALGSVSVTAKTLIATVQCSAQLVRQAPSMQDFLARLLLRSVRAAFDTALIQGTGASGQPQGLANLPTASGIQQVSGTSLAWAGILNAQRLASASGVTDSAMSWVGAPTVRETLAARERATGGGRFLWDDGFIAGSRALATPDAPASTLFVGDFSQGAVLALFGPGIEIRFDPANDFNAGKVAFQVLAICDIVFPQPAAFVRITSIT